MFTSTDIARRGEDDEQFETVYLARQPIVTAEGRLAAYELLFRSSDGRFCSDIDGMQATANVIRNAFFGMGIQSALSGALGFINVDERFLLSDLVEALEPGAVVLEILETVEPNPVLLERLRQLRARGYRFALDDYVGDLERVRPLLPVVDIVKFDVLAMPMHDIGAAIEPLRGSKFRLLAEKVEDNHQLAEAKRLGFTLFQGFHFAKPEALKGRQVRNPHQSQLLRLIELLQGGQSSEMELRDELKLHPTIVVKMLAVANSSAMGLRNPVGSLNDALLVLGHKQVLRIVNVLLFAGQDAGGLLKNPLFQTACSRGKLLEELVLRDAQATLEEQDGAFLVGMLSLVDGLLAQPMHVVLESLRLPATLADAILMREGRLGGLLALAERLELGDDENVRLALDRLPGLERSDLMRLQLEVYAWTSAISQA